MYDDISNQHSIKTRTSKVLSNYERFILENILDIYIVELFTVDSLSSQVYTGVLFIRYLFSMQTPVTPAWIWTSYENLKLKISTWKELKYCKYKD